MRATVPPPILADALALSVFLAFTVGYHWFYLAVLSQRTAWSVRARMHEHRRNWVELVLKRGERIMAVQTLRNYIMTNSFLASTMILLVAFIANFIINPPGDRPLPIHSDVNFFTGATPVQVKGSILLLLFAFAFVMFLSNLRTLTHLSTLMSVDADQIRATEREDAVGFLAGLLNRVGSQTTYGHRAVLFSIPVIGWLFSPWVFLTLTSLTWIYLVAAQDFARAKVAEAKEPAKPPAPRETPAGK